MTDVHPSEARAVAGHVAALCSAYVALRGGYPRHEDGSLGVIQWLALRAVRRDRAYCRGVVLSFTGCKDDAVLAEVFVRRGFPCRGGDA